jgi:hypothetical protein
MKRLAIMGLDLWQLIAPVAAYSLITILLEVI